MATQRNNLKTVRFVVREVPSFVKRMVNDKHCVQAYLRGEMTKAELEEQGIKLAKE